MRIEMDINGKVIKAEAVTKAHESGINCSRDDKGTPIDEAGRIAQDAFEKSSAERLVAEQTNAQEINDFNGEELITAPKLAGEE